MLVKLPKISIKEIRNKIEEVQASLIVDSFLNNGLKLAEQFIEKSLVLEIISKPEILIQNT